MHGDALSQDPVPCIEAHPSPNNLLVRSGGRAGLLEPPLHWGSMLGGPANAACAHRAPAPVFTVMPLFHPEQEWHFVLEGRDEFKGGVYHGKVTFPAAYPFKPPSIIMMTPNGR